jgi:flagellar biosynthesis/type III secretory pathway protein FliH
VELILSDHVVKKGLADDYLTWQTPLAGAGVDFSPFFSLTSPAKAAPKDNFSPAEVSVVSQNQAKHEDWQVFNAPHEEAGFNAAIEEDGFDGVSDEDLLPEVNVGHAEGYDAGYQEGYDKGFSLGQSEGETKGEATGIKAGQQQTQALEDQRNKDMKMALGYLTQVTNALSEELLQPMQNLALHLAKELVRGELSVSSHAIERLIMLSMEQLQITQSTIQVHMNPLEFDRLKQHNGLPDQVVLQPSNDISMGSIKVEHADSWVEDLMEDRLAQISQQVFGFVDEKFVEPMQEIPVIEPEVEVESEFEVEPEVEVEGAIELEDIQGLPVEQEQAEVEVLDLDEHPHTELAVGDSEETLDIDTALTNDPHELLKGPIEDD